MFFYLETLVAQEDLELDTEFAKQILDLYSDIVMLNTSDGIDNVRGDLKEKLDKFHVYLRASNCHFNIQDKL